MVSGVHKMYLYTHEMTFYVSLHTNAMLLLSL